MATLNSIKSRFQLLWLCSAFLVTLLQFLQMSSPGYDLSLQIQAAQNLLAGKGLSLYSHMGPDLSGPAQLTTLTHFPSAYSFCAAFLMWLGISVGTTVKVMGAAATMLGWWGWGRFARHFFNGGLQRGSVWRYAAYAIAITTPLLVTPKWGGTDIFLWAALPWVLDFLVRAADENASNRRRLDALAGALCGFAVLMRYASLFLVVYAACLILWQSRLRFPVLARRGTYFGLGLVPALALQFYINNVLSNTSPSYGGLSFQETLIARFWDGFRLLSTASYPWVFWFPGNSLDLFLPGGGGQLPWQLGVTLAIPALLFLVAKTYGVDSSAASRDPRIASLGLFIVLPLVLWGCMMLGPYDYLADRRYFLPIVPLSVFAVYSFASLDNPARKRDIMRVLQRFGVVYLTACIAVNVAYSALMFVPGERGGRQLQKLMGGDFSHWPSMAVDHEFYPSRDFVLSLLNEEPNTILLTSKAGWFYWDPAVDKSKMSELRCWDLHAEYLTGPVRIVILTFDVGEPQELSYYSVSGNMRADCFEQLPDLKLVRRFPEEGVKVLETRIGAGQRVSLRPRR